MAEKKSPHHDEFMKLHMFKEEYIEKLRAIGITTPEELAEALEDDERVTEIHEHVKGVGPKTVQHWKEDLGVVVEEPTGEELEETPSKPVGKKVRKAAIEPAVSVPKKAPKAEEKPEKEEAEAEEEPEEEPESEEEEAEEEEAEEEEEGEEEVEIEEEEEGYKVKLKPKLSKETLDALRKRQEIASRRPEFLRQEWHRRKRLQGARWRRPRGMHSKMRQHYAYRRNIVSIGFGSPKKAKHLHPSGFREVMVHNLRDLERINPETEAARVAHKVGMRKRLEIEEKADELGIRVLNRSG
jgi:large subunit ribosomal protein L32e